MTNYDSLVKEHDEIVSAMMNRKGKDASHIAQKHIENQEKSVLEFFKSNE
jgi:DNA-binding GntR family transcriptional regulator